MALYVRVSTDGQTTVNQKRELEAVAERHGWRVVDIFKDHAISGKTSREKRPAFERMLQGVLRKDFDLVAAWSVDRLGRSLQHLLAFLSELNAKKAGLRRATAQGKKLGRPRVAEKVEKTVLLELGKGHGIHAVGACRRRRDRDCSAHYEARSCGVAEA